MGTCEGGGLILCLKKPLECHGSPGLYTLQGAEQDLRRIVWPMNRALMLSALIRLL